MKLSEIFKSFNKKSIDENLNLFNEKEVKEIKTSVPNNRLTKNFFEFDNRSNYRINSSITKWRNAINYAEDNDNPIRSELYKIYNEVLLDATVSNSMDLRIQRVLSMPFSILTKSGKVHKKSTEMFDNYWFEKYIKFAMESIFFGHSLIQIDGINKNGVTDVTLIPRGNVVPEFGLFKTNEDDTSDSGEDYMKPKIYRWLCEAYHTRKDLGILNKCASYQISKKVAVIAWTQFVEKFGEPTVIGRTNSNLESEKNDLKNFLTNLSMNSAAVLDKQTEIEFKETSRPDVYQVYKELITTMNNEINTLILGGTEITSGGAGGSEARAKVHEAQSNHKTASDIKYIKNNINNILIPKLEKLKVIPTGLKFVFDSIEFSSLEDKMNIDKEILKKYNLSKEYLERTYGVVIDDGTSSDLANENKKDGE